MLNPDTGVAFIVVVVVVFFLWAIIALLFILESTFFFFFLRRPPQLSVQKAMCFFAYLLPDLHLLQSPFSSPLVAPCSEHLAQKEVCLARYGALRHLVHFASCPALIDPPPPSSSEHLAKATNRRRGRRTREIFIALSLVEVNQAIKA